MSPPQPENSRLLGTFQSELEARMVIAKLEDQGIEAWLIKDDGGSMYPPLQMVRGVQVFVPPEDYQLAHEIIEAVEEENDLMAPIEMESDVGGKWVVWVLLAFAVLIIVLVLLQA